MTNIDIKALLKSSLSWLWSRARWYLLALVIMVGMVAFAEVIYLALPA